MGFLRSRYSLNRWKFEGMLLGVGVLWGFLFLASAVVYVALPSPWGSFVALGFVFLIFLSGVLGSLDRRRDAR